VSAIVDIFSREHFVLGPALGIYTRSDAPGEERVIRVRPGWRYRACGSIAVRLEGVPLPAKTQALVTFTEEHARVEFAGRGFVTLTPAARTAAEGGARA
jgi:hypothetical protein